jgi:hypothetical protein
MQWRLINVIFLHPVARSITQSLSSVFVRRLIVYLTLKHAKGELHLFKLFDLKTLAKAFIVVRNKKIGLY